MSVPNARTPQVAIVTGGGRGIGRGIALRLAADGMRVLIVGRNAERLEETSRLAAEQGGRIEAIAGDVRTAETLEQIRAHVLPVQILVHSAAAYAPFALLERSHAEEAQPVFDTIFTAALRLTQLLLPGMKAQRYGRIVYIGSTAATIGGAGQAAYASAKAALLGLTRSVTCEAARYGVTCNLVELGLIDTERIAEAVSVEHRRQIVSRIPAGRMGRVAEVAEVVSFLTSPGASYIHGACLPVTGGLGYGLLPFKPADTDADL